MQRNKVLLRWGTRLSSP